MTTMQSDLDTRDRQRPYITGRVQRWRSVTDGPLLALAVGSLPLLFLELKRSDLPHGDRVFLDVVNYVVLASFAVDYAVEFALSRPRWRYFTSEIPSLMVVVAQVGALLPGLGGLGLLRALRGARAFRAVAVVARMLAIGGAAARDGRRVIKRRAASFALAVAALTCVTSAVAFTLAEGTRRTGQTYSVFDSLWWSVTTMATVGYGDISPTTGPARLIAVFTMLVGVSTFAVVTARIAEFLVRPDDRQRSETSQ